MSPVSDDRVILGKVTGAFGIKGWVKVHAFTEERLGIVSHASWLLQCKGRWQTFKLLKGQAQGKGVVAQLEGVEDRDQALALMGCQIAVLREQLPELDDGEYYWSDLINLEVVNLQGERLGTVDHLFETGANDVLVVKSDRERLVPWILDAVIKRVALDEKRIEVDWDVDF